MPIKPPRICGCGYRIAAGSRCPCEDRRAKQAQARNDQRRGSAHQRGYSKDWDREAKAFLALPVNRSCALCGAPATTVDHRIAHKGNQRLFWDRSNWQPVCKPCNSRKNVRTEGGFGNPIRKAGGGHEL